MHVCRKTNSIATVIWEFIVLMLHLLVGILSLSEKQRWGF